MCFKITAHPIGRVFASQALIFGRGFYAEFYNFSLIHCSIIRIFLPFLFKHSWGTNNSISAYITFHINSSTITTKGKS